MKQTDYLQYIRRRMIRSALFAALGLALAILGFSMRILYLDRPASFHTAWQMFATLSALLMAQALSRFLKARRILNSPDFYQQRSRIEEWDERTRQVEQMAWATCSRWFDVLLFVLMLAALAVEAMSVFWVCYLQTLLLNGTYLILRRRYEGQL